MPGGIHLPALQGIAGLKPLLISKYQLVNAGQVAHVTLYTLPNDKLGLLTDAGFFTQTSTITNASIVIHNPGMTIDYYPIITPSLSAFTALRINSFIAIAPGGEIYIGGVVGSSNANIFGGCSLLLFDYFEED